MHRLAKGTLTLVFSFTVLAIMTGDVMVARTVTTEGSVGLVSRSIPSGWEAQGILCGGAMLDTETIVTAAHCLEESPSTELDIVFAGRSANCKTLERFQISGIERIDTVHDVAFLRIGPSLGIATPAKSDEKGAAFIAHGWSSLREHRGTNCQPVSMPIATTDLAACESLGYPVHNDGVLCATPTGIRASCFGDSGSPIYDSRNGTLAGITLGGNNCSVSNPSLYLSIDAIERIRISGPNQQTWM